jgi:hypothetical protein
MLINVVVDLDSRLVKSAVAFFPPGLKKEIWVSNGVEKYLLQIPQENKGLKQYGRQIHWSAYYTESTTNGN